MFIDVIPHRPLGFGTGVLTFSVPKKLEQKIAVGQVVEIPLRGQRTKGIIVQIVKQKPEFETLDIGKMLTSPLLDKPHIDFVKSMSEYNFCSYSKTLSLLIPQKLWKSDGLPPKESFVELINPPQSPLIKGGSKLRGKKQKLALEILQKNKGKMKESDLREEGISLAVIKVLIEKGILKRTLQKTGNWPALSLPNGKLEIGNSKLPPLTSGQTSAFKQLQSPKKSLLFGPAGSGKTFLALHHILQTVSQGKTALFLMPEQFASTGFAKTFFKYFPREIADWYHSRLSEGEKVKIWWRIREGHSRVVFGTRSSLFLPFQNLGLIVVDEEHETSYKSDQMPRYHARKASEILADIHGSKLILQSSTPSFESYHRAQSGEIDLVELKNIFNKINQSSGVGSRKKNQNSKFKIQNLHIVDLRSELASKNLSPFSHLLQKKIAEKLKKKKQVLLFLNQRGKHSGLVCRQCGKAILCMHCLVKNTLHEDRSGKEFLLCHHCGRIERPPAHCPHCDSTMLKGFGVGTQEIEQEAKRLFPEAKVLRADRDATARKTSAQEIFDTFADGSADILIGTQIIGKSMHLKNVELVGIMLADTSFHLPDFRSSEYAFQLLQQVSGRIASSGGEVVLQTYLSEHPAVRFCAQNDFEGFYASEIEERKALRLPPYMQMIRLIFVDRIEKKADQKSKKYYKMFTQKAEKLFSDEKIQIALAPALHKKKHGKYHYHVFITGMHPAKLLEGENLSGIRIDRNPIQSF